MIAVDTCSLVAYFKGEKGFDTDLVDQLLSMDQLILPPVVLTEFLSDPSLEKVITSKIVLLPLLEIQEGFWERAGELRARIIAMGRKARIPDSLIAQSCLDHHISLITRDDDFFVFAKYGNLILAK